MKLNLSKVKFSNSDIKRNIIIPKKLTPELCEIIGILAGDGYLIWEKLGYYIPRTTLQERETLLNSNSKDLL